MTVTRVREVLFPFLLIILASFLTITTYYYCYARKIGVIFFLFQFKSMKLEYCNKGPPVKDANKYIFNIPVIKSQFIVKTLRF